MLPTPKDQMDSGPAAEKERDLVCQILAIGARCAALPDQDGRAANEILRYDADGLPR